MTMIIDGSLGIEFPDGSDQTVAFTGNAAAITTGVLAQANGGTGTTVGYNGFKNRIINGDMAIDQRNVGQSVTITGTDVSQYVLDRFYLRATSASGSRVSVQRTTVAPVGFVNSELITSLSSYTIGSTEHFGTTQAIEGFNIADLAWGTASALPVTLSFWVRSSLTGTFGGHVTSASTDYTYIYSYTINAANTWEYKTVTVPGPTTGTWLTNNGVGLYLNFSVAAGSSVTRSAGSWGTFARSVTGQTSLVGTSGATFYITGVQFEKGSTATSFDTLPYTTELQLCQRYYTKTYLDNVAPASTASPTQANAIWSSVPATNSYPQIGQWFYPVTMRATPTIVIYNPNTGTVNSFRGDSTDYSPAVTNSIGNKCVTFYGANVSVGTSTFISVHATADAEL
jgi:hypothetical protein